MSDSPKRATKKQLIQMIDELKKMKDAYENKSFALNEENTNLREKIKKLETLNSSYEPLIQQYLGRNRRLEWLLIDLAELHTAVMQRVKIDYSHPLIKNQNQDLKNS